MISSLFAIITFDGTINLTTILLAVLTVIVLPLGRRLFQVGFQMNQTLHDLQVILGTISPPSGILGDVQSLKQDARSMRDWSIEASSALEIRRPGGRS